MAESPEKGPSLPTEGPGSFAFWRGEADRSAQFWKTLATKRKWDENVQAYLGQTLDSAPSSDTVVVPKEYSKVEQKSSLLFFQVPEVTLTAKQPGLEPAIPVFQAVLNDKLTNEINASALMAELLFDVLCPAGIAASKIGYEVEQDGMSVVQQPAMDPTGQPIVDPMTGQPAMMPVPVPNIVHEKYFWERIPVKSLLIPVDFHGSDFDKAPWLGFKFETDLALAARTYKVSKDLLKPSKNDSTRLQADLKHEDPAGEKVCGYEIWYLSLIHI